MGVHAIKGVHTGHGDGALGEGYVDLDRRGVQLVDLAVNERVPINPPGLCSGLILAAEVFEEIDLVQVFFDVFILYRGLFAIDKFHLFRDDVNSRHMIVLAKQGCYAQTYIAGPGNCNVHIWKVWRR